MPPTQARPGRARDAAEREIAQLLRARAARNEGHPSSLVPALVPQSVPLDTGGNTPIVAQNGVALTPDQRRVVDAIQRRQGQAVPKEKPATATRQRQGPAVPKAGANGAATRQRAAPPVPLARPGVSAAPPTFTPRFELAPQPALRPEGLPLLTPERAPRDDNLQQFVRDELLDIGARHRAVVDRARAQQQAAGNERRQTDFVMRRGPGPGRRTGRFVPRKDEPAPESQDGPLTFGAADRGASQSLSGLVALVAAAGPLDKDTGARLVSALQQRIRDNPAPASLARFRDAEGFAETFRAIGAAPLETLGSSLGETTGAAAPAALVAGGVGLASGPLAPATSRTAFVTANALIAAGNVFLETLADAGVDLTDQAALAEAFDNEDLVAEALRKARIEGGTSALFDAVGGRVAPELSRRARELVSGPIKRQVGKFASLPASQRERLANLGEEVTGQAVEGLVGTASSVGSLAAGNALRGEETNVSQIVETVAGAPVNRALEAAAVTQQSGGAPAELRRPPAMDPRVQPFLTGLDLPSDLPLFPQGLPVAPAPAERAAPPGPQGFVDTFDQRRQPVLTGLDLPGEQGSFSFGRVPASAQRAAPQRLSFEPSRDPVASAQLSEAIRQALDPTVRQRLNRVLQQEMAREQLEPAGLNPAVIELLTRAAPR